MADTQQFVGQLDVADKKTQQFGRKMGRLGNQLSQGGMAMTAGLTLPLLGIGAAAGKTAIDFESSFAGIRKTMNLTEAEFARLAQANRDLATEIPVSVNEINRIGELAGQLGIRGVENVVKFEDTIAKLAVTTDLTADQAALAFAQIANVIGLPQDQIDRLGAAVVGLGNNFATTESMIVDFMQRISGAGKLAGLTAGDVAGIATALSSLGVQAEAGGTAVQKVLLTMVEAVATGNDALDTIARTAGMTGEEFRRAFQQDAGKAFVQFVEGLGQQGDQAIATLDSMGLADQRLMRSFLAAAGAGDLLREAVERGNAEFEKNTALQEEAAKRFETRASQIAVRVNQFKDALISLGIALFPVIDAGLAVAGTLIAGFEGVVNVFAALPAPLQFVIVGFTGMLAAIGPLLIVAGAFASALSSIIAVAPLVVGGVGGITAAVKGLTIALATNPVTMALVVGSLAVGALAFNKFKDSVNAATDEMRISEATQRAMAESTKAELQAELALREVQRDALRREIAAIEANENALHGWGMQAAQNRKHLQFLKDTLEDVTESMHITRGAISGLEEQEKAQAQASAEARAIMDDLGNTAVKAANDFAILTPQMVASGVAARFVRLWMGEAKPSVVELAQGFAELAMGVEQIRRAAAMSAAATGLTDILLHVAGVTDQAAQKTGGLSSAHSAESKAAKEAAKAEEEAARAHEDAARKVVQAHEQRKRAFEQYAQEVIRASQQMRQEAARGIETLGRTLVTALQRQHQQELDSRLAVLEAERVALEAAHGRRLRRLEEEKAAALAAVDEQLKALDRLDAADRLRDLEDQLALAFDPRKAEEIRQQIVQFEREQERTRLQENRRAIEERFTDRERALEDEFRARVDALERETEAARRAYDDMTEAWRLEAEARRLIEQEELDVITTLIEAHVPEWVSQWQSFSDGVIDGPLSDLRAEIAAVLGMMGKAEIKVHRSKDGGLVGLIPAASYAPPGLAAGGVITKPTFAYVGETAGARPEIVTPERLMADVFRGVLRDEGAGDVGNFEAHIYLDGRELASVVDARIERTSGRAMSRSGFGGGR